LSRHTSSDRIRGAQIEGRVARLRGVIRLNGDAELEARHREEWPQLWAAIDDLTAMLDQ
jgi:hypothetical protein